MAEEEAKKQKQPVYFPALPPKAPLTALSYSRSVHEAPYRALVGVVLDGREAERHPETPRNRVRRQAGLTNRWRLPESLYSDLLGTSQALKSINMPFNQSLVETITGRYPTANPMFYTCQEFREMNQTNWSLLLSKTKIESKNKDENAENEDYLPPL